MNSPYIIGLTKKSLREFSKLDNTVTDDILTKLFVIAASPNSFRLDPLTGQWKGYFKLRVGNYRAIFTLDHDEKILIVESVGHRREVYGGD